MYRLRNTNPCKLLRHMPFAPPPRMFPSPRPAKIQQFVVGGFVGEVIGGFIGEVSIVRCEDVGVDA